MAPPRTIPRQFFFVFRVTFSLSFLLAGNSAGQLRADDAAGEVRQADVRRDTKQPFAA